MKKQTKADLIKSLFESISLQEDAKDEMRINDIVAKGKTDRERKVSKNNG